jgi:large subunit ribosomal protein L20
MPRATNAPASRERRRRRLQQARGFRGGRSRLFRTATEAVDRALRLAYKHRRQRKGEFRALWTLRISAAARAQGLAYSRLMDGLRKARVALNRKMLSEIAVRDPEGFKRIVEMARARPA